MSLSRLKDKIDNIKINKGVEENLLQQQKKEMKKIGIRNSAAAKKTLKLITKELDSLNDEYEELSDEIEQDLSKFEDWKDGLKCQYL